MAVNPIIQSIWRDPIPEYCHGLDSSEVNTVPSIFVESLHGRSNSSRPRLPFHMHGEELIQTVLTSNIHIGWYLPKALTMSHLRSYEMFEFLLLIRINKSLSLGRILNVPQPRDAFPYRLARGIPPNEGVLWPLQSQVRTELPHCRWTILVLKISLNTWHPSCPLQSNGH